MLEPEFVNGNFKFDLSAKRNRWRDEDLALALQIAAEAFAGSYFTTTQYDSLEGKRPHSATIIERFGSWRNALNLIGIYGGRQREYSPEQLIKNLEAAWEELGFAPGKRQIASLAAKISERPYKRHWGSVRAACQALEAFHSGKMSRQSLLAGNADLPRRTTIPLKVRWDVLKRDHYRCQKCGAAPSSEVVLEIDHVHPVAKGGGNNMENLQTLCLRCNQGKKDR